MSSRARIYWACQIFGWGVYSVIGLSAVYLVSGWQPAAAIGYALFFGYSIALTHLERHVLQSRGWLHLPASRSIPRFAAAVFLTGACQAFLVVAIAAALGTHFDRTATFSAWSGITAANAVWVMLYCVITSGYRNQDLKVALREAELRALQAQINPHFLFNCLNTIRGMVVEDPSQSQEMITRLANILRYNLERERLPTVTLASEVEVVSDYLALESARFEDRLRVHFAIAPEAAALPVPAMLVQTLVENALKHGIASLPAGGDVVIRATATRDMLTVEIVNSGALTSAEPKATQVGLKNARERLRILYGDRASLSLSALEGNRVSATVLIPRTA